MGPFLALPRSKCPQPASKRGRKRRSFGKKERSKQQRPLSEEPRVGVVCRWGCDQHHTAPVLSFFGSVSTKKRRGVSCCRAKQLLEFPVILAIMFIHPVSVNTTMTLGTATTAFFFLCCFCASAVGVFLPTGSPSANVNAVWSDLNITRLYPTTGKHPSPPQPWFGVETKSTSIVLPSSPVCSCGW